ncbi:MAG: hypothetical protein R3E89_17345 [Thiolinea sp.]
MAFNASEERKQAILAEREQLLHSMQQTIGRRLQALAEEFPMPSSARQRMTPCKRWKKPFA